MLGRSQNHEAAHTGGSDWVGREGGREGGREAGREGGRQGGREGGREGGGRELTQLYP